LASSITSLAVRGFWLYTSLVCELALLREFLIIESRLDKDVSVLTELGGG
jgi:hypothetical protein